MKFTAVNRNDDDDSLLSERTRLLFFAESSSSSSAKKNRDEESSPTNKMQITYWSMIGFGLLLLLVLLFSSPSKSSSSSSSSTTRSSDEATMMQLLRHWDEWGKQQQTSSYDMWGKKKYTDESTTSDESSSSLRPKKASNSSTTTNVGDDTSNEEDRHPEDVPKKDGRNNLHHAQEWAQETWKNASHEAEQWWQDTDNNNAWQSTQEWFHQAWNQTSQQAHSVWNNLRQQEQPQIWWNQTVHTEQQWWNQTLRHLHRFGTTVQSWWGQATEETQNEEQVLGQKFQQWWAQAHQVERQWWKDTVQASRQFEQVAEQKTGLWWDATKAATGKQWNYTVHQEHVWWNATERWFHDHQLVDGTTAADQPLLYMNSSQAYSMLMNGYGWYDYSSDFFLYQSGWDVQINQAYCAVASSAALLNSLRVQLTLPMDPMYDPHPYATQPILLSTDCVNRKVVRYNDTLNGILQFPGGISLPQARQLLLCHLDSSIWDVTIFHVDPSDTTTDQVRRDLQSALKDPNARVLINYDRRGLGQEGGGHFSPLGSYSPQHDAFLIMDVAKYKYPPVWVPTARLVAAMGTIDVCGMWDFPQQQDRLAEKDLLRPDSSRSFEKAQAILGCEERFRGYLIVKRNTE